MSAVLSYSGTFNYTGLLLPGTWDTRYFGTVRGIPGQLVTLVHRSVKVITLVWFISCQDTSDQGHFGPKTGRHWCRCVRKTLWYQCWNVQTHRH